MFQKILKGSFVVMILLVLLAGAVRTFFHPKEINAYENRYSAQVPALTAASYLDSSFQDGLEDALADQIPFAQRGKKFYNDTTSQYLQTLAGSVIANNPDRYIHYRGMLIFGSDTLVYRPYVLADISAALDEKIANLNETFAALPDVTFSVYYIEKDTDLNFETGQKLDAFSYLQQGLNLPREQMFCYEINSFAEFHEKFYRTDHHWNHVGSYAGYLSARELLGISEAPMEPVGSYQLTAPMVGSKSAQIGSGTFSETIQAYAFDWPTMDITINGDAAADYGTQDPSQRDLTPISYGGLYGGDMGEIIFDTGTTGRGNLLVIGESYDNAILKLLATHYDQLYSIDLRYYETYLGEPFRLSAYLQEHEIQNVLLIGNVDYFIQSDFLLEN